MTGIIRYSIVLCILLMAGSLGVAAQKIDCTTQSDTDVVMAVYTKIKAKYPEATININVTANAGVVKLDGWVASKKTLDKIVALVKKIKCVKSVDNKLTVGKTGGCGPGQKECGGTCISEKEPCNICLIEAGAPGCLTSSPTKKQD